MSTDATRNENKYSSIPQKQNLNILQNEGGVEADFYFVGGASTQLAKSEILEESCFVSVCVFKDFVKRWDLKVKLDW